MIQSNCLNIVIASAIIPANLSMVGLHLREGEMTGTSQSGMNKGWQGGLGVLSLLFLLSALAVSQVGTQASITGVVTDQTGSAIVSAAVTATNLTTGERKRTLSGPSGNFDLLALPPGTYSVIAEAPGFKRWENPRVELTVGSQVRVAPTLQVGAVGETVTVQGATAAIQTESAAVDTVVQMQQIRELPLDTRNPLALVGLVPGMRFEGMSTGAGMRISYVQGDGLRDNKTNFQLDGVNTNDGSGEGGTAVPNVDAIEEFNVQTLNAGAEAGRDPTQVLVVTKSGTNEYHGTAFEFVQNDMFNAYNAFADKTQPKPRVRYNLFGGTLGGPIIKNKTFFFGSFQGIVIRNAQLLNEAAVPAAFESGDFSSLSTPIIDPTTGQPFQGNIIPSDRIDSAAQYFLPLFITPNAAGNRYIGNANTADKTWEYLGRIDHQITPSQRIYGRYEYLREPTQQVGYKADPSTYGPNTLHQHQLGINYNWTISNNTLFTATVGLMKTRDDYSNPALGKQNDSELAGIQGIPTAGREKWIGPPDIGVNGYTGISFAGGWGVPGAQWNSQYTGKAAISHVHGPHELNFGVDYGDRHAYGGHGSAAARGSFYFNGQYTGNGFADYLLGYTQSSSLNDPLTTFGEDRAPYLGLYAEDHWKVRRNLTLDLGVRYERYLSQHCFKNLCSVWDPTTDKVVVAVDRNGNPNFSTFSTSAGLAAQTVGLWETSAQAGYPRGLYDPNGNWSPRLGMTYRPFADRDLVLRAGFGTYYNIFTGNRGASEINMPTWTEYSQSFGSSTLQPWETVWAAGPNAASNFAVYSPIVDIRPAKTEEWNVSVQTPLFSKTALTVSYVGTLVPNEISGQDRNVATVGFHSNLQADLPFPLFSTIHTYDNQGRFWYNGLQTYLEHRFNGGLAFTLAYAFSRSMDENVGEGEFDALLAYSPGWYNRHRSINDYRHLESATLVWEVPYGRGRHFGSAANGFLNVVLGGWQLALYQHANSGQPLTIGNSNGNLGNGESSRADLVGDPHISDPTAQRWFNPSAFASAPLYTFGTSNIGDVEGPGFFQLDSGLSKKFFISEKRYFQFRWEAFNLFNNVNLNNPDQNVNDSNLGKIFGASTARYMQFGLKFLF
jgi:hypothetical protein